MANTNRKEVWLLVIDDHREAISYYTCDTIETARKLFEEIVREKKKKS